MPTIHNCHTHLFTHRAVPEHFFPFGLKRLIAGRRTSGWIVRLLRGLSGQDGDRWDKLAAFLETGNLDTQAEVFELLRGIYPPGSRFVALSVDMTYMEAGRIPQSFLNQLTELAALKRQHPEALLPFICVDPRRPGIGELVREFVEEHGFQGIKLYPPLGYYPFDERLLDVYAYAELNRLPVLTHCSRGGIFWRGRITPEMRRHPRTGERYPAREGNARFTERYSDPANYRYVLDRFPGLRLCLAHFGGTGEWSKSLRSGGAGRSEWLSYIRDELLISRYPHTCADIAYTLNRGKDRFHHLLRAMLDEERLRDRILFGSDFYVAERIASEREFSRRLRAFLSEDDYTRLVERNPRAFLGPVRRPRTAYL